MTPGVARVPDASRRLPTSPWRDCERRPAGRPREAGDPPRPASQPAVSM